VYLAMRAESARLGLPLSFKTDLTKHDRAFLRVHDGHPFGWVLHEHGTTLLEGVRPETDHAKRIKRSREIESIGNGFAAGEISPNPHCYLYDLQRGFRACEPREWIDFLTSEESEAVSHETINP